MKSKIQSKLFNPNNFNKDINFTRQWAQIPPFKYKPPKYFGPSYEKCMKMREKHLSPAAFMLYIKPVMIVDGKMQYLFDEKGKRYLDLYAGVATSGMGHCHPRITAKIKQQVERLQHTTSIYLNDQHCLYAEELAAKLPEGLD